MRLVELEPQFIRVEMPVTTWHRVKAGVDPLKYTEADIEEVTGPKEHWAHCDFASAHGIVFLCPVHVHLDGHSTVWAFEGRGCPPGMLSHNKEGRDTRWQVSGTGYDDLTMSPSLQVQAEPYCSAHFHVKNGEITA